VASETALIELKDVHKRYRLGETEVHALRGVSLTIHRGEFMALVGASGSGKSTLLNLVGCIDEPNSGEIHIDGQDISRLGETGRAELRNRKIGFVFQTFNLIPVLNAYENIELPLMIQHGITPQQRRERVLSAIEAVELQDFRHHVPDRLSGGQRQRVAIARALVTNPSLLIADEPTANLDSVIAHKILDLLFELNQTRKVTFLFSTHDEKLMGRVTRKVHIRDGMIQA
jgi:putative ABC transport system ATP-binding protein